MKVEPTYVYRCFKYVLSWQNNIETTLTELRRFNVDDPMLFQR